MCGFWNLEPFPSYTASCTEGQGHPPSWPGSEGHFLLPGDTNTPELASLPLRASHKSPLTQDPPPHSPPLWAQEPHTGHDVRSQIPMKHSKLNSFPFENAGDPPHSLGFASQSTHGTPRGPQA